jgi:hypothetical protein
MPLTTMYQYLDLFGTAKFLELTLARYWYQVRDAANFKLPAVGDLFGTAKFFEITLARYQ